MQDPIVQFNPGREREVAAACSPVREILALDGGHVWRMRDGKAVGLEVHSNRAADLKAAGLSE